MNDPTQETDDGLDPETGLPRMTLTAHLDELRMRLFRSVVAIVIAMIGAFYFHKELMVFVTRPFVEAAALVGLPDAKLVAIAPGEGFLQVLKLCFITGAVIVSPYVLWQMWGFVAAGLYKHERRHVRLFFPVSVLLFALGLIAAYLLLIPFGMRFLIGWNQVLDLETKFRLSEYLSTCLTMIFGMGLVFQLPLVMLFLQASDIVSGQTFKKGWRWAVLLAFVMGMVLTDPSPVTQILMAMPVVGLYFMGIWGGRFVGEGAEAFRFWKAWPLLLAAAGFSAMLFYADVLNDWAARAFGQDIPAKQSAPEQPRSEKGASGQDEGESGK